MLEVVGALAGGGGMTVTITLSERDGGGWRAVCMKKVPSGVNSRGEWEPGHEGLCDAGAEMVNDAVENSAGAPPDYDSLRLEYELDGGFVYTLGVERIPRGSSP